MPGPWRTSEFNPGAKDNTEVVLHGYDPLVVGRGFVHPVPVEGDVEDEDIGYLARKRALHVVGVICDVSDSRIDSVAVTEINSIRQFPLGYGFVLRVLIL